MGNITEYELTIVRREVNPAWTLYMNTPQIRMDGYNFTQQSVGFNQGLSVMINRI